MKFIPAEYWFDLQFCTRMMDESPACLRFMPINHRDLLRRHHGVEWLIFEDEWQ